MYKKMLKEERFWVSNILQYYKILPSEQANKVKLTITLILDFDIHVPVIILARVNSQEEPVHHL